MRGFYCNRCLNKKNPSNAQAFYGLHKFLNMRPGNVPEHLFPSGVYVFSRHSFIYPDTFIQGMVLAMDMGLGMFNRAGGL
jgi:hypothetical protein